MYLTADSWHQVIMEYQRLSYVTLEYATPAGPGPTSYVNKAGEAYTLA